MSTSALSKPIALSGASKTITPKLVYGTAWKKERTADLVYQALKAGFRGIDTAAQPRHYQEKLVGDGIRRAIEEGIVKREELFIQTKFTPPPGQDPKNMPYSASLPLHEQIHTSIASSLSNLSTISTNPPYIDSILLHSPLSTQALTLQAWQTLENYTSKGQIHNLGIANVSLSVLRFLLTSPEIRVRPSVVQNRFYPGSEYEGTLRRLCKEHNVVFQSFWTLTGNPGLLKGRAVGALIEAVKRDRTGEGMRIGREVALYSLVLGLEGVTVLDGTTSEIHMKEDLEGVEVVGKWAEKNEEEWERCMQAFRVDIGDI